jgi:hypothetical protein
MPLLVLLGYKSQNLKLQGLTVFSTLQHAILFSGGFLVCYQYLECLQ